MVGRGVLTAPPGRPHNPAARWGQTRPTGEGFFFVSPCGCCDRPGGTFDNSPALECWVGGRESSKSRQGRPRRGGGVSVVPGGTWLIPTPDPALKCWAIFGRPCGTAPTRTHRGNKLRDRFPHGRRRLRQHGRAADRAGSSPRAGVFGKVSGDGRAGRQPGPTGLAPAGSAPALACGFPRPRGKPGWHERARRFPNLAVEPDARCDCGELMCSVYHGGCSVYWRDDVPNCQGLADLIFCVAITVNSIRSAQRLSFRVFCRFFALCRGVQTIYRDTGTAVAPALNSSEPLPLPANTRRKPTLWSRVPGGIRKRQEDNRSAGVP